MLRVRRRVKIRIYGHVGGATSTINVVNDAEADWNVIVEETMDELKVDEHDKMTSCSPASASRHKARSQRRKRTRTRPSAPIKGSCRPTRTCWRSSRRRQWRRE